MEVVLRVVVQFGVVRVWITTAVIFTARINSCHNSTPLVKV